MPSATQLIRRDHKKVEGLFDKFDQAKKADAKKRICKQVIQELEIHTKLEEEIFYPAVRNHAGEEDMLEEAKQEHEQAEDIIRELKETSAGGAEFEDKFSELVECVKQHVEEEEGQILPEAEASEMDLEEYGDEMVKRKEELITQMLKTTQRKSARRKLKSGSAGRRSGRAA